MTATPDNFSAAVKQLYYIEFQRRYDESLSKEIVSRIITCAFVIFMAVVAAAGITMGSYSAAHFHMSSLWLTVSILSTCCFGVITLTAATLGGIYLDIASYSESRRRDSLNQIMNLEYHVRPPSIAPTGENEEGDV